MYDEEIESEEESIQSEKEEKAEEREDSSKDNREGEADKTTLVERLNERICAVTVENNVLVSSLTKMEEDYQRKLNDASLRYERKMDMLEKVVKGERKQLLDHIKRNI